MRKKDFLKKHIKHIDFENIKTISDLVDAFHESSFQSRNIAQCFDVYQAMLEDETRPIIFLGLAGAMVPGGMRKIIRDMIEFNFIDVLVSTGANLFHDFAEGIGYHHFLGSPYTNDSELRALKIDRIYDTLIDEIELVNSEEKIIEILSELEPGEYSSRTISKKLGEFLEDENSILFSAAKNNVPIFCPALNDSSIGIALTKYYSSCKKEGKKPIVVDQIRDNFEILQIKAKSKKSGAIYIGGGVPKNYIQQLLILLEALDYEDAKGHDYAIQITTDTPVFGGLSGCTFEEAISWGKVSPMAKKAQVFVDATIGLPLLFGAIIQKYSELVLRRPRLKFEWDNDVLIKLSH